MIEINIKEIDELIKILNEFENHYIFRGQSSAKWGLVPSIERILGTKWSASTASKFEEYSLTKFKSKYHLYDEKNRRPETLLQWLSLMQHYGVPTRLLDFSYSPYIALYFCLETLSPSSKDDIAIYAIDYRDIIKKSLAFIKTRDKDFKYEYTDTFDKHDEIFVSTINRFSYDILWVTEPLEVNLRLDRQAGCFLLSGNLDKKIEELLAVSIYKDTDIKKIIIPINMYEQLFALLSKVNINAKVLYGDLTGLSMSIRMELVAYGR